MTTEPGGGGGSGGKKGYERDGNLCPESEYSWRRNSREEYKNIVPLYSGKFYRVVKEI